MTNYIKADLGRIYRRVPRIIITLIAFAVFCLATFIYVQVTGGLADPALSNEMGQSLFSKKEIVFSAILNVLSFITWALGLFELIFVFSDDFNAKTMQIAIGIGVSRVKVVFAKLIELVVLLLVDAIILFGLSVLMGNLMGVQLSSQQMIELAGKIAMGVLLTNVAYSSIVFILMFATRSMVLSILGFLALKFQIIASVIGIADNIKALQSLHLGNYTLSAMLGNITDMAGGAAFNITPFLGVAAYMIVALVVTVILFRKKELDF